MIILQIHSENIMELKDTKNQSSYSYNRYTVLYLTKLKYFRIWIQFGGKIQEAKFNFVEC